VLVDVGIATLRLLAVSEAVGHSQVDVPAVGLAVVPDVAAVAAVVHRYVLLRIASERIAHQCFDSPVLVIPTDAPLIAGTSADEVGLADVECCVGRVVVEAQHAVAREVGDVGFHAEDIA